MELWYILIFKVHVQRFDHIDREDVLSGGSSYSPGVLEKEG